MKRILAITTGALLLAGCSSAAPPPATAPATTTTAPTITVVGQFTLYGPNSTQMTSGSPCFGFIRGYDNLKQGAPVTVTDAAGVTVGLGQLSEGQFKTVGSAPRQCDFTFSVPNVPAGKKFYTLSIAGHTKQYTEAEIRQPRDLSIGS